MRLYTSLLALLIILLASVRGVAQPEEESLGGGRKEMVATRIPEAAVTLDGRLDDEIWKSIRFASDFVQKDPNEGRPPSERTEIAFAYDDHALYVAARMYHTDPSTIRANVTRRDNSGTNERIIVVLDTYHDRRTSYSFSVTAAGVRTEYYHATDSEWDRDFSFDPVWEARTRIDQEGWTAEMRIPLSQLRFNDLPEQVWGLNIDRYIPSKNEDIYWRMIPKNLTGWASRFGELVGIRGIHPSQRIELLPYVAANLHHRGGEIDSLDPFVKRDDFTRRAGLDVKVGIGPNLTLDATVNPDFGQVEADPAQVNLSAFETFFDERRPFFIEGGRLLKGNGPNYFYSRRIGAEPHGRPPGDYSDPPENTTILGAAKLTGRLASGLSIGALGAVTDREETRTFEVATNTFDTVEVEPRALFGVVRLQQEIGDESASVGVMATAVSRSLDPESPLAGRLAREAYTGGVDWLVTFDDKAYTLGGYAGASHVAGEPGAMVRLQRASARYFQRPDADYVAVDTTSRTLSGYTAGFWFEKEGGEHWQWSANLGVESPGFELNELGRLQTSDDISLSGEISYRENTPADVVRSWNVGLNPEVEWNYGGDRTSTWLQLEGSLTWNNFWNTSASVYTNLRATSDNYTRGGPNMEKPFDWGFNINQSGNWADPLRWSVSAWYGADELNGWNAGTSGNLTSTIGERFEVDISPSFNYSDNSRQYITTLAGGETATFGSRYIFSFIEQTNLSLQLRVNVALTPDLSLEAYAEAFTASGRYHDFGELPAAGARDLRDYDINPDVVLTRQGAEYTVRDVSRGTEFTFYQSDFNYASFNSNLVLRWEWLRGSTLYLVWQQNHSDQDDRGKAVQLTNLFDGVRGSGDTFLALKASYWFSVH